LHVQIPFVQVPLFEQLSGQTESVFFVNTPVAANITTTTTTITIHAPPSKYFHVLVGIGI
jgi:hypothetical protein